MYGQSDQIAPPPAPLSAQTSQSQYLAQALQAMGKAQPTTGAAAGMDLGALALLQHKKAQDAQNAAIAKATYDPTNPFTDPGMQNAISGSQPGGLMGMGQKFMGMFGG